MTEFVPLSGGLMNAADGSNFTGTFTRAQVQYLLSLGIKCYTAGAGRPNVEGRYTIPQIEAWLSGGGQYFDFYRYLYLAGDGNNGTLEDTYHQISNTIDSIRDYRSRMFQFWGDVEDVDPTCIAMTIPQRIVAVQAARLAMLDAGVKPGWNTGKWWWNDSNRGLGGAVLFPNDALWDAFYSGEEPSYPFDGREYGGWKAFQRIQFQGSVEIDGLTLDLSWDKLIAGGILDTQPTSPTAPTLEDRVKALEERETALNAELVKREQIREVASLVDSDRLDEAWGVLHSKGFV